MRPRPTPETITYLAYLEEMATMYPYWAIEAPGLGALRPRPVILENKFVRARFSGIRAALFDEMKEVVGLFRGEAMSAAQRRQRRVALRAAFERHPIPVIDLFWSGANPVAQRRRERTMRLHHWFELDLSPGEAERAPEPVFMGEPDAGRPFEAAFESGRLVGIRALAPQEEEPLRDIFSLIHVPDADFGEDPGGPSTTPPPDSDDSGEGGTVAVALNDEKQDVAETELAEVRSTSHDRLLRNRGDDRQFVTVGR